MAPLSSILLLLPVANAFAPVAFSRRSSSAVRAGIGDQGDVQFGGNTWKPDEGKMAATDTPDFFPEDYDENEAPDFTEGMGGSQAKMSGGGTGTADLPGMENFSAGGTVIGGYEESGVPEGFEFKPSSVLDEEFNFQVMSGSSKGGDFAIDIKPFCMGFEDYFAGWAEGSHPSLSVSPDHGRMDRRGGDITTLNVHCNPQGKAGVFEGTLVVVLPEENEKLSYKVAVKSI
ncbi:hypothetical protein TrST_g12727 [Triparma strigata]|uniref:Uncharacterized protein n=1 Tax=Triparma strigata TaxID=1606541 RepID=A0A9W7B202_9STRA|nr:hypothetical protein TrST_g12727 [Triparma strigata]